MIQPDAVFPPITRPRSLRVIQGGQEFDMAAFSSTLTMLESYVDSVLEASELPAMDPWVDDPELDVRLASF